MKNLTPMQAAYWTGRQANGFLGNVAAHLYVEFDCGKLDPHRLEKAVRKLYESHDMMRMRITPDGRQHIGKTEESLSFEIEDLTGLDAGVLDRHLADKRERWTCRTLDLAAGQTSAFGLSVLPGGACRLHVDTDMVAIDPPSFCLLMEDLARFYEDPRIGIEKGKSGYFDWLDRKNSDSDLARRHSEDKRWWQERLAGLPPAPNLPAAAISRPVRSGRLAAMLSPEERRSLTRTARGLRITPSALMLGLFTAVVGEATGDERFRLNVPMFWRAPFTAEVERLVGDFSNILILAADPSPGEPLGSLCKRLAEQMLDLLAHSSYPGVNVMRDLSRARRSLQTAPIVFTSGLDLPGRDLFSERVARVFGPMSWAVSQGPQVALDAQVAAMSGGILINWDIRYDALPETWINSAFDTYVALARKIAKDPAALEEPAFPREATAHAAGNASRHTEYMLRELLTRLVPAAGAHGPGEIRKLGLSDGDLTGFVAFLNRYIPGTNLTLEDIGPASTAASLASVIRVRSAGASEKVGLAYLKAIDARDRASLEAQPAE
ncbi:condensation domain-containing protein [Roseibium marinum]|uniref:Condensation domain-containing protein n=1 Tax=Roseibium marinum TaxID=281252 RepID=A0A2S3UMX1_9HYPH|nr:condensation domain-containing protein [Roseibium marinum]POF29067.1 condensation domain-containing protein [Roseibium marinum]